MKEGESAPRRAAPRRGNENEPAGFLPGSTWGGRGMPKEPGWMRGGGTCLCACTHGPRTALGAL
jgi:hypothetical protein